MTKAFFVSDLHGSVTKYEALLGRIKDSRPDVLFVGGDILPSPMGAFFKNSTSRDFLNDFLVPRLQQLRSEIKEEYPAIFIILGNDDGKQDEPALRKWSDEGLWQYCHKRCLTYNSFTICGYSYVPPTPFRLKDWEKYDVSRYVDPGCVSPESGMLSTGEARREKRFSTIASDLAELAKNNPVGRRTIFLFHSPPYNTKLDRAALDGKKIDHVPLDTHVGSIAIQRFIQKEQPLLTLHGHIHESAALTGSWNDTIGETLCFNAAHSGKEVSIITFDLENPLAAERFLI